MSTRAWTVIGVIAVLFLVLGIYRLWPRGGGSSSATSSSAAATYHGLSLRSTSVSSAANNKNPITVDLYVPARTPKKAPLVILLQGNDPFQPDARFVFGAEVGDAMQRKGITAASIAFQISEGYSLRKCAADIATVIEELDHHEAHDAPSRIVLIGRGIGAWMAAMLALDRRLFEAAHFDAKRIDGVIAIGGTYDLTDAGLDGHPERGFFESAAETDRRDSSPAAFARADAPPFLLLNGGLDKNASLPRLARTFALALEKAGARAEAYVVPHRDRNNITHWVGDANDLGELVVSFINSGPLELPIENPFGVRQRWSSAKPPLDNNELRADPKRISTFPVDAEFKSTLMVLFERWPFELNVLPGKTYEAIDLLSYLASRPESEVGKGDYLVVKNLRDEQQYFTREDLEKTKPVLVVGMDDETNLYRLFMYYRLKRAYSWRKGDPEPMPMMIRPLGAFLHFPNAPPPHLKNKSYAPFGLTSTSFKWVSTDPLNAVRDIKGDARDALLGEQGCLKCHQFRGVGARAHHVLAIDGKPNGAFGLPLEEYPTDVLRRFLFDQEQVARIFDVAPLRVEASTAQALFDLVTKK